MDKCDVNRKNNNPHPTILTTVRLKKKQQQQHGVYQDWFDNENMESLIMNFYEKNEIKIPEKPLFVWSIRQAKSSHLSTTSNINHKRREYSEPNTPQTMLYRCLSYIRDELNMFYKNYSSMIIIINRTAYASFISSRSFRSKCSYFFLSSHSYQLAFAYNYTVFSIGKA